MIFDVSEYSFVYRESHYSHKYFYKNLPEYVGGESHHELLNTASGAKHNCERGYPTWNGKRDAAVSRKKRGHRIVVLLLA
jgi:hypothetical protein